ncbi:hypothetical protein D187_004896 [Cystobacter fuscus DSM 2262]|uniref:Uncharacterized protein n=1 Tax=Cystobacter fuscus (strain ATCC 25194 / DSM 2262 / NBRC 100088 / M29) TaxID=1242864 RepID=S9Q8E8_CYSF2|nr:hypothetical protein D187_004896 [Cystobacter fuscus DSM 2262]
MGPGGRGVVGIATSSPARGDRRRQQGQQRERRERGSGVSHVNSSVCRWAGTLVSRRGERKAGTPLLGPS